MNKIYLLSYKKDNKILSYRIKGEPIKVLFQKLLVFETLRNEKLYVPFEHILDILEVKE